MKSSPLLEVKVGVHNEEDQSHEADKEMKNDWMLAAAVLDRICAIGFTIVFTGGTLIFVILFVAHP